MKNKPSIKSNIIAEFEQGHSFVKTTACDMKSAYKVEYRCQTKRIDIRPFTKLMAASFSDIANDSNVQATDFNFTLPFTPDDALETIKKYIHEWNQGSCLHFSIWCRQVNTLIGGISIRVHKDHRLADIGYWIGHQYWNKGFCTAATKEIIRFGFQEFKIDKLYAQHMGNNPASGRIMQKLGMYQEGYLKKHWVKDNQRVDLITYGLLREEFQEKLLRTKEQSSQKALAETAEA